MNTTLQQLRARKSTRVFTDRPIPPEAKAAILEAAVQAPTAGNQQLYTIIDVTDPAVQAKLVETCDNQAFIGTAQMVLVFCADCKKWYDAYIEAGCSPRLPGAGDLLLAVSDTNIAAQNAVCAAESLGIGSCYIGDVMENCEAQRELLGLPRYVFPAAMLVFGYPPGSSWNGSSPTGWPCSMWSMKTATGSWRALSCGKCLPESAVSGPMRTGSPPSTTASTTPAFPGR